MKTAEDVLAFWLDELTPADWYAGGQELDQTIRDRFESTYDRVREGALSLWLTYPSGTLAYIILTDQFPRNMFRDTGKAFETDGIAKAAAKAAISKRWDMRIDAPARQFFYMPLMHSECLEDQERCVRLFKTRMAESAAGESNLLHARAHREIIRRYGRFPTRNHALSRNSSGLEQSYLEAGGYGTVVKQVQDTVAA